MITSKRFCGLTLLLAVVLLGVTGGQGTAKRIEIEDDVSGNVEGTDAVAMKIPCLCALTLDRTCTSFFGAWPGPFPGNPPCPATLCNSNSVCSGNYANNPASQEYWEANFLFPNSNPPAPPPPATGVWGKYYRTDIGARVCGVRTQCTKCATMNPYPTKVCQLQNVSMEIPQTVECTDQNGAPLPACFIPMF